MSAYASCRSCSAAIIWATTGNRKKMPLDREPDPDGIVLAYCDEFGGWHCRAYVPGEDVRAPWKRYTSHFASCPHADEHRAPKDGDGQRAAAGEVSSFLENWRKTRTPEPRARLCHRSVSRARAPQTHLNHRKDHP